MTREIVVEDGLEIHSNVDSDSSFLFTVYTHGTVSETFYVADIDVSSAGRVLFADPNSDAHGEWYAEVLFDEPRTVTLTDDNELLVGDFDDN